MAGSDDAIQLVDFIAKALVSNTDDVRVRLSDDGRTVELETADEDRGRVIGRQGRVAKAIRALIGASSHGEDMRLDILD